MLTPIAVEVSAELAALLGPPDPKGHGAFMTEIVPRVRERLFAELGLTLPAVRLRAAAAAQRARPSSCQALNEVPLARGEIAREDFRGGRRASATMLAPAPLRT